MLLPEHLTYDRMQASADLPGVVRVFLRIDGQDVTGRPLKGDLIPVDVAVDDHEPVTPAGLVATAKAKHCAAVNTAAEGAP